MPHMCMHTHTHYKLPSVGVESAWRRRNCVPSWGPQCPQPTARFLVSVWGTGRGGRLASLSAVSFLGRKSLSRCIDLETYSGLQSVGAAISSLLRPLHSRGLPSIAPVSPPPGPSSKAQHSTSVGAFLFRHETAFGSFWCLFSPLYL